LEEIKTNFAKFEANFFTMSSLNCNNNGCGFSLDLNVALETEKFEKANNCIRGRWTLTEDDKLRKLVKYFGPHNWNHIAEHFHRRPGIILNSNETHFYLLKFQKD
jgi:hypothetical protein